MPYFLFLPQIHITTKIPTPNAIDRVPMLKAQYDEAWQLAADEDREKAPLRFVPRMITYR